MKEWLKKWLILSTWIKLLYPKTWIIVLFTICSTILLTYIFMYGKEESVLVYIVYVWSAYTLTVVCIKVPRIVKKIRSGIYNNSFGNRFMTDTWYRVKITLRLSLAVNVFYSVFKFSVGMVLSSWWLIAIAVYYIIMSVTRYLLLRHMKQNEQAKDLIAEHKRVRICGYLVVVVNVALSGMVVQMIWRNESYTYPGFLIFAAAAYAFYSVTMSIINLIRYRKKKSPILSAAKTIGLVSALVSILALQTAMITQFGSDRQFQFIMNILTGTAVCASVMTLAVFMIVKSDRAIMTLETENMEKEGTL